jgi:hypothetical protein
MNEQQRPTIDDMIEGVMLAIQDELVPYLSNDKAVAAAAMMTSVLQGVRQLLPVRLAAQIEEHNDMTRTLREIGRLLQEVRSPEADRIRERVAAHGHLPNLPPPPDLAAVERAHHRLSRALESCIADLDAIQRAGGPDGAAADAGLAAIRAHLAPRYLRTMAALHVGEGFVGRG